MGSDAVLRNVQISASGAGANGALVAMGSKAVFEDLQIDLGHERSGIGLDVEGDVEVHGGAIHARGEYASAVSFATEEEVRCCWTVLICPDISVST